MTRGAIASLLALFMVHTTSATGAGGVPGMTSDSAELESKADVEVPVE